MVRGWYDRGTTVVRPWYEDGHEGGDWVRATVGTRVIRGWVWRRRGGRRSVKPGHVTGHEAGFRS